MAAMVAGTMTFSKFLRESGDAMHAVEKGTVRLERRDGEDLILRLADRDDSEREGLRLAVALLSRTLADTTPQTNADVLADVFPWMSFLPNEDRASFAEEIIESIRASSAIDRPDLISTLVTQWKNTAEVWADPQLRGRLESEPDLAGQAIPRPG